MIIQGNSLPINAYSAARAAAPQVETAAPTTLAGYLERRGTNA